MRGGHVQWLGARAVLQANGGARGDVRAVLEGDARAGVSAGAGREVEVEREGLQTSVRCVC